MKNILQNFKKFIILAGSSLLSLGVVLIHIYEKDVDYKDCFDFEDGQITKFNPESCEWEKGKNKEIIVPDEIDGKTVKSIGTVNVGLNNIKHGVFEDLEGVSVKIPNTVSKIDDGAFYNSNLESIKIPNTVKEIGIIAFGFNSLESIKIPNSVTKIKDFAFHSNNLKSLNLPDSVVHIGYASFASNSLESVSLSNSLSYIRPHSFAGNKLKSINIPNSIETIESNAFRKNQLKSVEIPDSVRKVAWRAFGENPITKVRMPANMKISNAMGGIFDKEIDFGLKYVKGGRKKGLYIRDNPDSLEWIFEGNKKENE